MHAISDIGRFSGGGIPSGRLLGDVDGQESPDQLQQIGLNLTNRLIESAAGDGDGFTVTRGSSTDFLGLGSGQVYAGVGHPSSGSDVLDGIFGTVDQLQNQLDQQLNAASTIDPSNQAGLQQAMFQVQFLQSEISQLVTEATDILKTLHDTTMAIVQNFKTDG